MDNFDLKKYLVEGKLNEMEMTNEVKELIKENLDEIMSLDNGKSEMYNGLKEVVKPLYDYNYWSWIVEQVYKDVEEDEYYEEGEELGMIEDEIGYEVIRVWGETWYNNLINMGFKYEDGGWNIDKGITNYGLVWDYWVDLDTSPREKCSEILDEIFDNLQG